MDLASAPDAPHRLRSAIEIGALALSALVAVGVAVLFLALTGASRTIHGPRPQSSRYAPLSQSPRGGTTNSHRHPNGASPRSTPASVRTAFQRTVPSSQQCGAAPR